MLVYTQTLARMLHSRMFLAVRRLTPACDISNQSFFINHFMLRSEVIGCRFLAKTSHSSSVEEELGVIEGTRNVGITPKQQKKLIKQKPSRLEKDSEVLKVAIIGAPNAGKSTLTNQLLGWKIAPVSSKVHTTRQRTLGALTLNNKQVIFLDTPGLIVPGKVKKHNLERTLLTDPHSAIEESDLIAVVVDVSHVWHRSKLDLEILKALQVHLDRKSVLILNKVDLIRNKQELLSIVRTLTDGVVDGVRNCSTKRDKEGRVNLKQLFDKARTKNRTSPGDLPRYNTVSVNSSDDGGRQQRRGGDYDDAEILAGGQRSADQLVRGVDSSSSRQESRAEGKIIESFSTTDEHLSIDVCESTLSLDELSRGDDVRNIHPAGLESRNISTENSNDTSAADTSRDRNFSQIDSTGIFNDFSRLSSKQASQEQPCIVGNTVFQNDHHNISSVENERKTFNGNSGVCSDSNAEVLSAELTDINASVDFSNYHQKVSTVVDADNRKTFESKPCDDNAVIPVAGDCGNIDGTEDWVDVCGQNDSRYRNLSDKEEWNEYYKKLRRAEQQVRDLKGWPHFSRVFMISAISGDGVTEIKDYLLDSTYRADWMYHPSLVTDQNPIRLARLCVWERLLEHLPDEIPYQISVKLCCWEMSDESLWRASFDIICPEKRHLRHVLGPNGKTIRKIASESKQELMNAFRRDLSLRLVVRGKRAGIVSAAKEGYH